MPDMNEYVYGVGFKLNTESLKQAKNDLKINLEALSKMVKSYGNVLKIDPNADLSKLFEEMRKIKGIVDAVGDSDVSFGNFVDKGTLSRIATLENSLQAVSATSDTVEASIADLRNAVAEVTGVLKQAGSIKFPATFDNLFADKSQKASQLQVKVKQLESVMQQLRNSYKAFQDSSDQSLDENIKLGEISTWIKEFQTLQQKIADGPKTGRKLNELYADLLKISELGQKLNTVIGSPDGQDILKNLGLDLDSQDGIVFSEFLSSIPKQIETLIANVAKQRTRLMQELNQLGSADLSSKAKRSLGVAANADGSNYTLRAKIIPDTDEVSWANTINDTIKNIEPRLSPVRLTPTFSNSSKNLQKEVDGNLAKINHVINVDLQVHDNLTQFNEKIQHIDTSIKNAKQQLEKNGNFTIKFDYEEGGKFKDTAYQIINKFKKIDAHFYVANGKTFLKDIAGIKEKAKKEFKDIPITLAVGNKDKVLESVIDLRNDISKKVDNIGVNLNLQNVPQVIQQAAIMRDSIEQYYENNPIGNIAGPSGIDADANSASRSIVELSEKAKKAQEDVEKIKSTLKSLTELGFKSPDFLKLGVFDKDGKYIKGSKDQLEQILQGYDELYAKVHASKKEIAATYGTGDAGYQAYQSDLSMLEQTEGMLTQILQGQIQYSKKRLELAEQTLAKEKQVTQEKAKQTSKTVHDNAQSQTAQETKNNQQLAMSAEEAEKKIRALNGTLSQQKKVLKDLDAQGINAASFTKLGEWDKASKSFKKNSQEIQELLKRYRELQKARLAAGGTKAVGEEASLRGKLAAILKEQKKHVAEIIAANQSELASVKAIASAQKQARASQSGTKQAANTKAAAAEQDKLNKKIKQQQQILNDLNKKGWQSKYFAQLGTWDKETQKFKKNATEMQILIKQYMDLKKAREDAGIKSPVAGSEELKLRGRIGALLKEQKKHIAEIIAKNQEELKSAQKTADAYRQADAAKADTDKKPVASAKGVEKTTNAVDELNASLEKAKKALNLLQSGKIDIVKSTGLGDIGKRIDASGIKQSLAWIVNRYKILLTKKQEFEKAGATGSDEYVRNEKQIQIYEQLLTNIYQDQLKYTQSRIGQLETEIAKRKEILALQEQQGKAEAAQQARPKEQKQQQAKSTVVGEKKVTGQIPKDASSVVKLDGATLKSLAKDSTLKSIDGKLGSILQAMGHKPNQRGNKLNIEAKDAVINSGASAVVVNRQQQSSATSQVVQTMSAGMQDRINRANALSKAGIKISRGTLLRDGNDAFDQILQGVSPRDVVQNIIWPKLVNQLKAKGLTDSDQFNDILAQIAQGSAWQSKTSSSWIHFATPDAKFNDKITKKAYASFANVGDISSELINQILSELRSRGYKGQIKIPSDITGFYDTDQIVGHAVDDNSFMILVDVLKQFEKLGTLLNVQTGVDANTKVSFGAKGKQGASFTTMLEEIYKAAPGQVFSVDEIKSIIKTAVASTSGDVDQALFKPIVEDVIRKRGDQAGADQIAASADRATREQSELNAELAETAQKDGATANINDNIAQDAERATQEQRELNSELENTRKLSSSVVVHNNMTGDVSKIVDTYRSDDKVNETQEIYGKVSHGKDNPPTFEHTATVTKTNMEAYNKLYKDYIKSLSKQLEIEQKIASTNGPTSKFQEDLKVQKEITAQLESQLQKHTALFTEQSKQAAIAEATKNANQATATSNAKASDAAINKQITALNKAVDSAQQKYRDMSTSVNELSASTASPIKEQFVEYERLLSKLKTAQQDVANNPQLLSDESYVDGLKQLLSQIDKAENRFNVLNQSAAEFAKNIRSANDIKIMDASTFNANNITQMHDEMRKFANAAGFGEAKLLGFNDANRTATFEVKNGKGQVQQLTVVYNQATNALGRYVSQTTESTSRLQQFFTGLKKSFGNVARYLASFGSIYELFAVIRQGVTYVRDIDSALTELKKVTDETDASYDRFLQNMSKTAGTVGSTVAELTKMAAEWSRLGYSMSESAQLAESTAILLNVSEFSDATTASEALISTMQAFGYAADESQHVVDVLNEVGNNYAVSSDGIATALQDSASALMEAGNTLEQSTALVAAANKVVQDPNSVGSALRTISLRLRGTSVEILEEMGEETDGVVESTSKLQAKLKALTGVDILTDAGAYKDTYTILKDIGTVWQDLSNKEQAAALELMAGKNRANTLAAILNNMDDLTGAYESALDAEGSAVQENAAYLDSIQGRIDLFTNAVQTMWMNFLNDDVVKFVVNLGTAFVKLVDAIGVIPTAVGAFTAFKIAAKSIGKDFEDIGTVIREAMNISGAEQAASDVAKNVASNIKDVAEAQDENTAATNAGTEAKEAQTDATMGQVAAQQIENATDKEGVTVEGQETKAIHQNTTAQQQNAASNLQNAAADKIDNVQDQTGAVTEQIETSAINQNTAATVANTVAQKATHAVATAAKGVAAGVAVGLLIMAAEAAIGWIVDAIQSEERTIERATETLNEYRDSQKALKDQKKTTDELAESYTRLSSGVNTLTNDNIGLTVESYNEYLDVCNQIAEMYPSLVESYDAQGNAILSLKGNVDGLVQSLEDAAQASRQKLIAGGADILSAFQSTYDSDPATTLESTGYTQQIALAQKLRDLINFGTQNEINKFFNDLNNGNVSIDGIKYSNVELDDLVESSGIDEGFYKNGIVRNQKINIEEFKQQLPKILSFIKSQTTAINTEKQKVLTLLDAYLKEDDVYKALGESSKQAVDNIVSSLDANFINGFEDDIKLWTWVKDNIVGAFSDDSTLYDDLTNVSNNMAKAIFDNNNAAFTTAQSEFNAMIKDWVDASGDVVVNPDADFVTQYLQKLAKDIQNQAKHYEVRVQIKTDFESKDSIDQILADYTGDAKDDIQKAIDDLDLEDGVSIGDIYGKISIGLEDPNGDGKLRSNEIEDIYDDYLASLSGGAEMPEKWSETQIESITALHNIAKLYGTDVETLIALLVEFGYVSESLDDVKSFDLASESTNKFIDEFQESIDLVRDAWKSLNSGDMTKSEFIDLAQKFPKLMESIDFSQDNWMTQAKANLEALNGTLIDGEDGFITKLNKMKEAMTARDEDTTIIDQFIAWATQLKNMPLDEMVDDALKANTLTGLTETYEKYKSIIESTNEVVHDGQKVSKDYYESLKEYIDDTDALNACFDENNKQIVTNVDALKELIAAQKESDISSVKLAKDQAQLKYYELVRELGDNTRSMMVFSDESDAAADALFDQIGIIKNVISQYQRLEDSLLGTTSAFEKFAQAKTIDDQNTYGASYVEMTQTMYDALYKTGEVGSAQFWAAVEATVPDDIYKNLTPGQDQLKAISDYLNNNVFSTLTLDDESFSINYTDVENFVKKAQETGVFFGADEKSFGLSADFIYGLTEGENALEAFAKKMNMTVPQVYAMLSEMDKYTADGTGLSMLLQLDQSTTGQITYATSLLERLYTERQRLLKQGADNNTLKANEAEIAKYESYVAGLQKQVTDAVRAYASDYVAIENALANTSKNVSEVLSRDLIVKIGLDGNETVEEALVNIKSYQKDLEEPTVMELEIAKQNIEDDLADLVNRIPKKAIELYVKPNKDTGLYEVAESALTIDPSNLALLERYAELMNASAFIDESLEGAMSTTETLLTNIDSNVSKIAGESTPSGNGKENGPSSQDTKADEPTTDPKPAPNQAAAELTLNTSKELSAFMDALTDKRVELSLDGPMTYGEGVSYDRLGYLHKEAKRLQDGVLDGSIFAEDAKAQLSALQAEASKHGVIPIVPQVDPDQFESRVEDATEGLTVKADVDLNSRPLVPFDTENFGAWEEYYKDVIDNAPPYYEDYINKVKAELDALKRGDSTATVYSQTYYKSDFGELQDGESDAAIVVTPILPDGTVLSPYELEAYAQQLLNGEEIEPNITLGFFDGENFAADAQQFAEELHQSQAELYGLSDATQSATSEAEALMQAYASNREALATLEAIEDKTYALTAEEAMAFGIQLNEGEVLTVEQLINRIKRAQESLSNSSLWNPESKEEAAQVIYTYTALAEQLTNFNDMMTQTQEIISDGTEVTQAYKDSLTDLGLSSDELSSCFESNNELVVKNAKLLNNLVKNSKKNVATNIKLAKSQAQLKYYELYKQIEGYTDGTRVIDAATLTYINSLYSQMSALEQTIAKYSMLEAQLLGAANAYKQLEDAQNADNESDYGSKAEEMVNVLANAFNSAELGTQAAQVAIKGLIPESEIDKAKTLDEQMQQIYEYFTTGKVSKLFTIEFGDDGSISSVEMTKENVEAFTKELIEAGEVFHGSWDEFTLDGSIKSLDDFAEKIGVTKEVAFAYLTELEKYDINWLKGDHETLLDQLMGDNLEYNIQKTTKQLAELQKEKISLMEGGITDKEQERINQINAEMSTLNGTMDANREKAYEMWQEYSNNQNVLAALDQITDKTSTLTEAQALELGLTWDENKTVQEYYDEILAKQALLGQPTELVLQFAREQADKELEALAMELGKDPVEIKANVKLNPDTGAWEYTGDTTGWSEDAQTKLKSYLDNVNNIEQALAKSIASVETNVQTAAEASQRTASATERTATATESMAGIGAPNSNTGNLPPTESTPSAKGNSETTTTTEDMTGTGAGTKRNNAKFIPLIYKDGATLDAFDYSDTGGSVLAPGEAYQDPSTITGGDIQAEQVTIETDTPPNTNEQDEEWNWWETVGQYQDFIGQDQDEDPHEWWNTVGQYQDFIGQDQLDTISTDLDNLTATKDNLETDVSNLTNRLNQAETDLNAVNTAYETASKSLNELQTAKEEFVLLSDEFNLGSQLDLTERDMASYSGMTTAIVSQMDALTKEKGALELKYQDIEAQIAQATADVEAGNIDKDTFDSLMVTLNAEKSNIEASMSSLAAKIDNAALSLGVAYEKHASIVKAINSIKQEKGTLDGTIDTLDTKLQIVNQDLVNLRDASSEADLTIEVLKGEKSAATSMLDALMAELNAVNSELEAAKSQLNAGDEDAAATIELLTTKKTELETAASNMESQIASINIELATVMAAKEATDQAIATLVEEKAALETEIASLTKENATLGSELDKLEAALSTSYEGLTLLTLKYNTLSSDGDVLKSKVAELENAIAVLESTFNSSSENVDLTNTTGNNQGATTQQPVDSDPFGAQNEEWNWWNTVGQYQDSAAIPGGNVQAEQVTIETDNPPQTKDQEEEWNWWNTVGQYQDQAEQIEVPAEVVLDTEDAEEKLENMGDDIDYSYSIGELLHDEGLSFIPDIERAFSTNGHEIFLSTKAFREILGNAEYTNEEIAELIDRLAQYDEVVVGLYSGADPLQLNKLGTDVSDLANGLARLHLAYRTTIGTWSDDKHTLSVDVPELINTLKTAGWTERAIGSYISQLLSIDYGGSVIFNGAPSIEGLDALIQKIFDVPEDKETNVEVTGAEDAIQELNDVNAASADQNKTVTVTTRYVTEYTNVGNNTTHPKGSGGRYTKDTVAVNGTAHAQGTAHKGGSWGAPATETALTGELGPELRVRGNRWELLGEHGAEFNEVRKGDIIFNHKQTEQLLTNGYITGRGKAFAEGTVGGAAFAGVDTWDDAYGKVHEKYSNKGGEELEDAAKELSKAAEDVKEVFDWIAVRIEEINEDINLKSAKLENAIGSSKQNAIIDDMIALNQQLYDNLTAGAAKYDEYAQKLLTKIPEEYRKAAQNGSIAIEEFDGKTDKETFEAIQNYREWVQKGSDATQQAEATLTEIQNLAKQAIDNIAQEYENEASIPGFKIEQLEAYNALIETTQGAESAKIYEAMIKENNKQIGILAEQRNKMQSELNAQVESGNIKKYSQAWYDAVGEIAAVDTEIINLTADTEDYKDAINDIHSEHFDNLLGRLEAISDEAENLIDILGNEDLVDKDTGEWTDEGITSLGLYAQKMEVAEMQANKYKEEIQYLNKNWKQLGYTEQEYIEKLEELKNGQYDSIKAYNDSKKAIVDLTRERVDAIKEGIDKEIEAYEELISKKKEELDSEKDLYDFQRNVANQQKEIATLERKLAAISSDSSASARAKRAQLEAELAEKKQGLEDTYYDRSVSDQQKFLDKELEYFKESKDEEKEAWDKYLEDTEKVVSDSLATVQSNTKTVYDTLQTLGSEYSLSIAGALTSPWKSGEDAIQKYTDKFKMDMSATVVELKKVAKEHEKILNGIEAQGDQAVGTVAKNEVTYTSANNEQQSQSSENASGMVSGLSGNIQYGHSGDNVKQLQKALNALGFNCGSVDGIFGDKTYAAVLAFQKSSKFGGAITADGIVGTNTKKKFKVAGYAGGTTGIKSNQFALIDELGEELVIRPSKGKMTFLEKGSGVVPADLTANLMEWGELDPSIMLERNKPVISAPHVTNNNVDINMEFGEVVHIDTVTNDTIPNLTKAIEKQMDKYMKNVNNNIRKYTR